MSTDIFTYKISVEQDPEVKKTFFILKSQEHRISPDHKF